MIDEARARKGAKRLLRIVLVWTGAALMVAALVGDRGLIGVWRARQQSQELTRQINHLRDGNKALREAARRLREDPAAIEDLARRELGLIRPGEKVFIVRDVPAR
jgi:cell division protein FtsB